MNKENERVSKKISYLLRHGADKEGLKMDEEGWVDCKDLCSMVKITKTVLEDVVATNDKKRFAFSADKRKIRASQGHTLKIDLKLKKTIPPDKLYHGTIWTVMSSIFKLGLIKMERTHVHLSADIKTATTVGSRRGTPTIIVVNTAQMHKDGFEFFLSDNGVWLTDNVPSKYLEILNDAEK